MKFKIGDVVNGTEEARKRFGYKFDGAVVVEMGKYHDVLWVKPTNGVRQPVNISWLELKVIPPTKDEIIVTLQKENKTLKATMNNFIDDIKADVKFIETYITTLEADNDAYRTQSVKKENEYNKLVILNGELIESLLEITPDNDTANEAPDKQEFISIYF